MGRLTREMALATIADNQVYALFSKAEQAVLIQTALRRGA